MIARFQERVKKLVDVDKPNISNAFKNDISKAYDEVREKKKDRRNRGDTRQKKVTYTMMCHN